MHNPTSEFLPAKPRKPNVTATIAMQTDEPFKRWDMTPRAAGLAQDLKNAQLKNDFEEINNIVYDAEIEDL